MTFKGSFQRKLFYGSVIHLYYDFKHIFQNANFAQKNSITRAKWKLHISTPTPLKGYFLCHMVWDSFITREQGRWREITHLAVHHNNKQENNLTSHPQNNSRNFTFSLYYLFPTPTLLLHSASPGYLQKFTLPLSLAFSLPATDWSNGGFFWTKKQQGDFTTTFCHLLCMEPDLCAFRSGLRNGWYF